MTTDRHPVPSGPHAFIQWKGTEACMDFRCPCGGGGHFDGGFAYFIRCPDCRKVYEMGWYVTAQEARPEDADRNALEAIE